MTLRGFADRLDALCYESGMIDRKLAESCGVNRKTILAYRHGESTPNCATLAKMCKALQTSADYLLFGETK